VENDTLSAAVSVNVANTGDVAGAHVVQVYVRDPASSVHRPVRELKGFVRVELAAGERRRVRLDLDQRAFSFWSERFDRWAVEAGEFVIEVGHHSRDLPVRAVIDVDAPPLRPDLDADATLHEWIADPIGRELLVEAVDGGAPDALRDEELISVVGTMPMSTLANFGGLTPDLDTMERLTSEWRRRVGRQDRS
jgi:beta-glucosidase